MLYVRGNRRDYDSWEQMGNYGWGYDHVLPYFTKSEDNRNPYLAESPYHGVGGYLTVQEAPYKTPLATAFVEGGVELGNKTQTNKMSIKSCHTGPDNFKSFIALT
jgi:choline dehydrogenase